MLCSIFPLLFKIFVFCAFFFITILFINNKFNFKFKEIQFIYKINLFITTLCAVTFLIFAFYAPKYISSLKFEYLKNFQDIAATINSLMNPFIAIAAAILTFMAFWIQYNANQKINYENKRQQIERQFYEMLKIHNDNVKSFYIRAFFSVSSDNSAQWQNYTVKGQTCIEKFLIEFNFIYYLVEKHYQSSIDKNSIFLKTYNIFYFGAQYAHENQLIDSSLYDNLVNYRLKMDTTCPYFEKLNAFKNALFRGHISQFNSYYRHLFLIVKTIINIDDKIFDYSEKRQFLRILRAQLTSAEQVLLFYNWKSGCGGAWEGKTPNGKENHFFTDYRMIHNINPNNCVAFNKYELMTELTCINPNFKYEGDSREKDPLFELIE